MTGNDNKNKKGLGVIFFIRNRMNNKMYIAYRKYAGRGLIIFFIQLRLGVFKNVQLQKEWMEYGENNFTYGVLDEVETNKKKWMPLKMHYIEQFDTTNPDRGYNLKRCFVTRKETIRQNYWRNRDKFLKSNQEWRSKNGEWIKNYHDKYNDENRDIINSKQIEYYNNHKEERKRYNKKYYKENRKKIDVQRLAYRRKNREKLKEKARIYRQANRKILSPEEKASRRAAKNQIKLQRLFGVLVEIWKENGGIGFTKKEIMEMSNVGGPFLKKAIGILTKNGNISWESRGALGIKIKILKEMIPQEVI